MRFTMRELMASVGLTALAFGGLAQVYRCLPFQSVAEAAVTLPVVAIAVGLIGGSVGIAAGRPWRFALAGFLGCSVLVIVWLWLLNELSHS